MIYNLFKKNYSSFILLIFFLLVLFPQINFAKISDKRAVTTLWTEAPIMPGAAKYFIRSEKIEKKTKNLNNHPIKISEDILRKMLKQLSYKYDRDQPEIPLFSKKELMLLTEHVPKALMMAKPTEDITFVIKGSHASARWSFSEERLTAGRLFVANNQLNLIIGAVQVSLQPTLDEQYMGNVWETTKLVYDIGHRKKVAEYEGMIVVYNQNKKGIYRKNNERKDWFVFTNAAYKAAKEEINVKKLPKEQYKTLQQQIDSLQKQLNKQPSQKRNVPSPSPQPPPQKKKEPVVSKKQTSKDKSRVLEQRLNTIDNLYKKGILSEEEYQRKRIEILKGI